MITLLITLHIIICFLLIAIILIQAGRGGGLVEGFSGVESIFGTKTNAFLTRTTSILSVLFFLTCLGLAFSAAKQTQSLMKDVKTQEEGPLKTTQSEGPTQPEETPEEIPTQKAPQM